MSSLEKTPSESPQKQFSFSSPEDFKKFVMKWTPRVLVAGFVGYYSLGIAYDLGVMAAIDKVAIRILKNWVGYAGVGAAMPTVQWYTAWAVRVTSAGAAGILYDLGEKVVLAFMKKIKTKKEPPHQKQAFFYQMLAKA